MLSNLYLIILVCVRWYCKYGITYRDLAEMMQERGVEVDASRIFRWVQRSLIPIPLSRSTSRRSNAGRCWSRSSLVASN